MSQNEHSSAQFRHTQQFAPGEVVETLGLGPHERHYEELFAEVLADGVITPEERVRLNEAADSLGLDRVQLMRLETAMMDAYQARHNVEVVEHYQKPTPSLIPPDFKADGDATHAMLLGEIERLRARVQELEEALRRAQAAINVEVDLEQAPSVVEPTAQDPETCWRRVRRDPTNPDVLRALYAAYDARSEADKCWCAAQALVLLDRATPEERRVFEAGSREGLIAPRASVGRDAWVELLMHPDEDALTGRIFGLIAPAVVLGRVTALRHEGKLYQPERSNRQDPANTTIMAVRALPWAAAILGIATPPVFTEKARDGDYEHIPGIPPVTVIGRRALSGPSPLEHAFLVGRHLAWYRPEHYVQKLFSAVPNLEDLFLAALAMGSPGLPMAEDVKRRVLPLARAFQPLLEPSALDGLRRSFLRFVEAGGRTNLQRWSAAVEKTACRAGLLVCGDLSVAVRLLAAEEGTLGELAKDLIVFSTSEPYFQLRQRLGIALQG
ncbi:MAG: hypothetical protein JW940_25775 [Polyangiaceae bacterium]|nr:hypothetical protein [Polyangiaceae bacterium]